MLGQVDDAKEAFAEILVILHYVLKTLQPFLVADMARVYSNSVSLSHRTLQSLAIGLRFSDRRYYTMDVSVAQPVGDRPTNASHRSPRINLLWSYQFD